VSDPTSWSHIIINHVIDIARFEAIQQDDGTATMPPVAKSRPAEVGGRDEFADQLTAAVTNALAAASRSSEPASRPASEPAPQPGPPPTRRRRVIMNLDRAVTWSYRYFLCQSVSPLIPVTSDHPTNHELRRRRHRQNDNWFALLSSMPTYVFSDV
jgi:hypothetical protein